MKHESWRVVLLCLVVALVSSTLGPAAPSSVAGDAPAAAFEGRVVVRAYYADRQLVNDLAAWLEPWEVHHDEGYLVVAVGSAAYQRMLDMGFHLEIDEKLTAELNRPHVMLPDQTAGIPGYPCYRTVEETFATAESIVAAHPSLAAWIDVGDTWEKTEPGGQPGYDMMVLRLTNAAVSLPKPKLFVMTSVHAREYTPAELNTRFAEYLVDNYGLDPDVTWLLDYTEVHLLLQANPDGRKHAEAGDYWRKNTNENYCSPTSNYRGADLNRNFEFQWACCGGSSGIECDETYRGPSPASEPETQTIQNYVRAEFPDQRGPDLSDPVPDDATGIFLDIHSYSELVLWPWGFTSSTAPNNTALQTLGRKFAYFNDYRPEQAIGLYPTDGTTDDFAYGDLGLAAYTFELGTAFFQSCATFESTILPDNLQALIYAAKASRTPYLTPAGPDALDVMVVPGGVVSGQAAHLTATIDDTRYNNQNGAEPTQNIAAAEYYVDVPPWDTAASPVARAMSAVDGAFDAKIEGLEATLDTTGLSTGQHILFVRGQDAAGNWGPFSAVFLYILEPGVSPVIEGYVREETSNDPLAATVSAGSFQAQTDPATGYYSMTVVSGTYEVSAVAADHAASTVTGVEASDYETVQVDFQLPAICHVFFDNLEAGVGNWGHQAAAGSDNWSLSTARSYSPDHAWFVPDDEVVTDSYLWTTAAFPVDATSTLSFWHRYGFESIYDGGVLEISANGGAWQDLALHITSNGYNGVLSTSYDNPLGGRSAWVDDLTTWTQVQVDLSSFAGQNVRIRWRLGCDRSQSDEGWYIDDVLVEASGDACTPGPKWFAYLPLVVKNPEE